MPLTRTLTAALVAGALLVVPAGAQARATAHSLADLARIQDAIPHAAPFAGLGADLVSVRVDPDSDSVQVGVARLTPELADRARAAFGDAVTLYQRGRVAALTRTTDSPPFHGGDRLSGPGSVCSAGFTLTNYYGTHYLMTAAHCWGLGSQVTTNGYGVGTVQFRRYGNGNLDAELIGGSSYAGRVYAGSVGTTSTAPVHSAANSCTGCQVYFDGSFTGQALATLVGGPGCLNVSTTGGALVYECGLQEAKGAGQVCQPGDSGGPVYAYDGSGGLVAVGIATAGGGDDCWYTRVPDILASWQSTIATG